jgi:hypothetical protein
VDAEAHEVAWLLGYQIVVHPPVNLKHRAWVEQSDFWEPSSDVVLPEQEYLVRNHAIVETVEHLIVVPAGPERDSPRSGSWWTYRAALRMGVPVTLIMPPGVQP